MVAHGVASQKAAPHLSCNHVMDIIHLTINSLNTPVCSRRCRQRPNREYHHNKSKGGPCDTTTTSTNSVFCLPSHGAGGTAVCGLAIAKRLLNPQRRLRGADRTCVGHLLCRRRPTACLRASPAAAAVRQSCNHCTAPAIADQGSGARARAASRPAGRHTPRSRGENSLCSRVSASVFVCARRSRLATAGATLLCKQLSPARGEFQRTTNNSPAQ